MFAIIVGLSDDSERMVLERSWSLQNLELVNVLLLSGELLIDGLSVIDVVRERSEVCVKN